MGKQGGGGGEGGRVLWATQRFTSPSEQRETMGGFLVVGR